MAGVAACLSDLVLSARAQKISRRAHWLSDPDLRQHSHAGLNKGEASNSVRRAVFFHRQGEIRDRTFENQSFRASGLSPITAAIVHWNTVYLDRAVRQLAFLPMAIFAARDRLGSAPREAMAATIARNWVSL
jgi:TnpA family transposase